MEWVTFVPGILAALLAVIGIPIAIRRRKQESPLKLEQFLSHIQALKIEASLLEKGSAPELPGTGQNWGQKSEGLLAVRNRNYEYINIVSVSSQYGVMYYLDYLVTPDILELRNIAAAGELIVRSALIRKESRGLHYTLDYPDMQEDAADTVIEDRPGGH